MADRTYTNPLKKVYNDIIEQQNWLLEKWLKSAERLRDITKLQIYRVSVEEMFLEAKVLRRVFLQSNPGTKGTKVLELVLKNTEARAAKMHSLLEAECKALGIHDHS